MAINEKGAYKVNTYQRLSKDEKKIAYTQLSNEWNHFIQEKNELKDIRLLYASNSDFLDILSSFQFTSVQWVEDPSKAVSPSYQINIMYKQHGIRQIMGKWGAQLKIYHSIGPETSKKKFNEVEMDILKEFLEEFEMDKAMKRLGWQNYW